MDKEELDNIPGIAPEDAACAGCAHGDNRCNRPGGGCDSCNRCPRGHLHSFNWLDDIPGGYADSDLVEVQFKNTRKGYYRNSTNLPLKIGDMVAVEATPGHDIGQVTMVGALVNLSMRKANIKPGTEIKRVFRLAKANDLEKYREACAREIPTMIRARRIAEDLKLNMKIGDVEYQGDGNKAIFYYIADERVDFRQLIKILAEAFHVRIEMKQIGARQEAGRIGGIGPCGRPLCCASWMTNFVTVATSAARQQDISLNPQKLAGQCAKLKCCLNFEVDTYVETIKQLPAKDIVLETADATYYHFKTDIFKKEITYSTDKKIPANLVTITAERAFEIIEMNRRGEKPVDLRPEGKEKPAEKKDFGDILGQDDLTRFDKKKKKKSRSRRERDDKPKGEQRPADNAPDKEPRNPKDKPQPQGDTSRTSDRTERPDRPRRKDRRPKGSSQDAPDGKATNRNENRKSDARQPRRESKPPKKAAEGGSETSSSADNA